MVEHVNVDGPAYDAAEGMRTSWPQGHVWVNTDGSRYVVDGGKFRRESAQYTGPVATKSPGFPVDVGWPSLSTPEVPLLRAITADAFASQPVTVTLPPDYKLEYVGPSRPGFWTESSTCKGILRAIKEASGKCEPTKPLLDAMEFATVALLDFHSALGKTRQIGWNAVTPLSFACASLAHECGNAYGAGLEFWDVALPCAKAIETVTVAIKALDKAPAKEVR